MKREKRTCPRCREEYPFTPKHWYIHEEDGVMVWNHRIHICKFCKRADTARDHQARRERIKHDPELVAAERKNSAESTRKWRKAHPEKAREVRRRYEAKIRRDPARRQARLENRRIAARLRAERNGRPLDEQRHIIKVKNGVDPQLPIGPLVRVVLGELERRSMRGTEHDMPVLDRESFCEVLGITARTLLEWEQGRRKRVRFFQADEILTALGLNWWDVWEVSELSERTLDRLAA